MRERRREEAHKPWHKQQHRHVQRGPAVERAAAVNAPGHKIVADTVSQVPHVQHGTRPWRLRLSASHLFCIVTFYRGLAATCTPGGTVAQLHVTHSTTSGHIEEDQPSGIWCGMTSKRATLPLE